MPFQELLTAAQKYFPSLQNQIQKPISLHEVFGLLTILQ